MKLLTGVSDLGAANRLLADGTARGALFIPADLERNVLRRRQASVVILGNGAYPLLNRTTSSTFTSTVLAQDTALDVRHRLAAQQSRAEARAQSRPVTLDSLNLFNPTQGYASSVIPAVGVLIVHQTMLIGIGVFLAARRERRELPANSPLDLVASILAFATIGFCTTLY
jgi:ABC-2 type transport system permease protein